MSRVRRAAGVASRTIDGRAVLVIQRRETLHSLNRTGTFLWERLSEPAPVDELSRALAQTYGISDERAREDVDHFVETLVGVGALEPERANG